MFYESWRDYTRDSTINRLLDMSSKVGNLDRDEERGLVLAAQAGSDEATELLVVSNIRYCFREAIKCVGKGVEVADLFSAAMEGLLKGIKRFDVKDESGARLLSYAKWWIMQMIQERLDIEKHTIKTSRSDTAAWRRMRPMILECDERRRCLDIATISEESGVSKDATLFLMSNSNGQANLDASVFAETN